MNHGLDVQGAEGLDPDEAAVRRLLHDAVRQVEPDEGALDHLRRAVPARRARKRQALVGMAAAALFVGTAVPAILHVSDSGGIDVNSSNTGHGEQAQGGLGEGEHTEGVQGTSPGSTGEFRIPGTGGRQGEDKGSGTGTGADPTVPDDPQATALTDPEACAADQLGTPDASVEAPDAAGAVYGTFRFSNVSAASCVVSSPGSVGSLAVGAADQTKITTIRHTAGDAAASLPDPSEELTSLALEPGESYTVKFAWIPSETCPAPGETGGGTGGPETPADPTPTDAAADTTDGAATDSGTAAQTVPGDGTLDGGVTISNTTQAGGVNATVTVSDACAGTVYWTGVLAGS